MTDLEHELSNYIDHLQDPEWISKVCAGFGMDAVLGAISAIVRRGDTYAAHNAMTFARDVGIYGIADRTWTDAARARMPTLLFPALRDALYAAPYNVRSNAVYTIGKLSFKDQAPLLADAFAHHRHTDPLLLPRLVGELSWLGSAPAWEQVDELTRADQRLLRWSALAVLELYSAKARPRLFEDRCAIYERLSRDSFDLLRDETRYHLATLREKDSPAPRRPSVAKPKLTFDLLEIRFMNQSKHGSDYTIGELDAFVDTFVGPRSVD